jgi:hypothetical protein
MTSPRQRKPAILMTVMAAIKIVRKALAASRRHSASDKHPTQSKHCLVPRKAPA